jgi:hypothetical protein
VKTKAQVVLPALAAVLFLIAAAGSLSSHQTLEAVLFGVAALSMVGSAVWNAKRRAS